MGNDADTMGRIALTLGVIAFLAIMIFGANNGPTMPFVATFPTFSNPFSSDRQQTTTIPIGDNTTQPPASVVNNRGTAVVPNCLNSTSPTSGWFGCERIQDDIGSYVTLNVSRQVYWTNISGPTGASNLPMFDIVLVIQCQSTTNVDVPMTIGINNNAGSFLAFIGGFPVGTPSPLGVDCPSSGWANVTGRVDFASPYPVLSQFSTPALTVSSSSPYNVSVSFTSITFEFGAHQECTFTGDIVSATAYIGCQIISFGLFIIKVGQLAVNVVVFIGSWLWTLVLLIGNFFAVIVWLYSIPGMPQVVQLFVDAVVTGLVLSLIYILVRTLRGASA